MVISEPVPERIARLEEFLARTTRAWEELKEAQYLISGPNLDGAIRNIEKVIESARAELYYLHSQRTLF